jgi:hypothetical protein
MTSSNGREKSRRATKAEAASRASPADTFNIDREGPAKRAGKLRTLQQHFQKLDQHYETAVAEIRASLDRPSSR